MTANSHSQPNLPPPKNGYNPITAAQLQNPSASFLQHDFGQLVKPIACCVAAPLVFSDFTNGTELSVLAPLAILLLLGCVFFRLEDQLRKIAAVPLVLAAFKLAGEMASHFIHNSPARPNSPGSVGDPGFLWLPLFLSACLVFMPRRDSATFKVVLAGSCLLLASGLLPGDGFIVGFYLLDATIFFGIVIGLLADVKGHAPSQPRTNPRLAQ
jgi:hypothetical protein